MENFKSKFISCKPIDTLDELISFNSASYKEFNVSKLKLEKSPNERQFIVCHDMKNNYLDDKYFQGANESQAFEFFHWQYIDMFIYFSHHFVTIPPETWINAAHENNCRMLGTFITEWNEGKEICEKILVSDEMIDLVVDKLVDITLFFKFDGWLINIENVITNVSRLESLVKKLTLKLKEIDQDLYKVIWYDSVINTGELKWQNELNEKNECFFNVCDGIFINYTWKDENLQQCQKYSDRLNDIFIGVDVFGRGCLGDGGFNTNIAINKLNEYNLNCALFAPGWLHECNPPEEFITNSQKFWQSFGDYVSKRVITHLPLTTTFSHGRSNKFFLNGELISSDWSNLSMQTCLPIMTNWCFEDAFYAGSSALVSSNETVNLFVFKTNELTSNLTIEYACKEDLNASFYFTLVYNDNKMFDLRDLNQNSDLRLVKAFETVINNSKWKLIKFEIEFLNKVSLSGLNATSLNGATRLGFLRINEGNDLNQSTQTLSKIDKIEQRFELDSQKYFCAHLKWIQTDAKYYNVFIETDRLKYVGSTRSNDYRLCLKLKSNNEPDSNDSFKIRIHPVDQMYKNVLKPEFSIIEIQDVKLGNESDYDVVYDLELF